MTQRSSEVGIITSMANGMSIAKTYLNANFWVIWTSWMSIGIVEINGIATYHS